MVLPYPKAAGRRRIRVKAFAVILDATRERLLVARMSTAENPVFHRPLGGSVEVGEQAAAAVVREIAEELDATLVEPELLGVLENIFTINGETGHEVVFAYAGRLLEPGIVPPQGRTFWDVDEEVFAEWRPVTGLPGVPLFPTGMDELVRTYAARRSAVEG